MNNAIKEETKEKLLDTLKRHNVDSKNLDIDSIYEETKKQLEKSISCTNQSIIGSHMSCTEFGICNCAG